MTLSTGDSYGTHCGDMGEVDEAIGDDAHVCHPGKQATGRRLDTPTAWDPIGCPLAPQLFILAADALAVCTL